MNEVEDMIMFTLRSVEIDESNLNYFYLCYDIYEARFRIIAA